jgi:hypothetical protein
MNLPRLFRGTLAVLGSDPDWAKHFDLSRDGFKRSFLAPALMMPCLFVCATAVIREANRVGEVELGDPTFGFFLIAAAYAATFLFTALVIVTAFNRRARYEGWVVVRHWAIFFITLFIAAVFGLNVLGVLPFPVASNIALGFYLLGLVIDIRLAQRVAGFEWGGATLAACLITAMSLTVLLVGVTIIG